MGKAPSATEPEVELIVLRLGCIVASNRADGLKRGTADHDLPGENAARGRRAWRRMSAASGESRTRRATRRATNARMAAARATACRQHQHLAAGRARPGRRDARPGMRSAPQERPASSDRRRPGTRSRSVSWLMPASPTLRAAANPTLRSSVKMRTRSSRLGERTDDLRGAVVTLVVDDQRARSSAPSARGRSPRPRRCTPHRPEPPSPPRYGPLSGVYEGGA